MTYIRSGIRLSVLLLLTVLLALILFVSGIRADSESGRDADPGAVSGLFDERCRTTYEIFVYSFCDSDGDGIGDLNGVRSRLDYIQDLGFDQIWLMPVCPSPTYHKYDVTDYMAIDPAYGTMEDFDTLIEECHRRGIRVITDLVLNHSSAQHPWFLEAADYLRSLPEGEEADTSACPKLDYYHFTQIPEAGYAQLPDTSWYYEARFWDQMPDLNLDSEAVRDEIRKILSFWLEKGVDGFRLDAVTYYYSGNEEQNIAFLCWLKDTAVSLATVSGSETSPYIVCEAWIDQSLYAQYYASGVDSMFDFAYAGAEGLLAKTVKGKSGADRFVESLAAEQELYASVSDTYVNAPFYTNHDLDRSAGYYAYDDGSRTKFALGLNLLISGNAFLYYGDELGMKGSGKDENKRAPMFWTDGEGEGMCSGPADMDSIKQKFPSVREQENDPLSILNYTKQAISLRNEYGVIRDGTVVPVTAIESKEVGAYLKVPDSSAETSEVSGNPESAETSASTSSESTETSSSPDTIEVIFNSSEEPQTVDLSASGSDFRTLAGTLCVSEEPVSLEGDLLTLPPFGIAILTEQ